MNLDIDKELFTPLSGEEKNFEQIVRPSARYWADAQKRLKNNKAVLFSLIMIVTVVLFAFLGPVIMEKVMGYAYYDTNLNGTDLRPSTRHWFGTNNLDKDLFIGVMYGSRYSLMIAISAAAINLIIGVLYGGIADFFGGKVDNIMMRIVDVLYSIPTQIYAIILMTTSKKKGPTGLITIILAMAISYWVGMTRIVRGDILLLKQQEFVPAAKALGAPKTGILLRHLIPSCLGSVLVTLTLSVPQAIFTGTFLSFIGLGINAPLASLGTLANDASGSLSTATYQLLPLAGATCIIILAFNLFNDELTGALDPKNKRREEL